MISFSIFLLHFLFYLNHNDTCAVFLIAYMLLAYSASLFFLC